VEFVAGTAFFLLLALIALWGLAGRMLWRAARRSRIARQPFPPAWRDILRRRFALWPTLPAHVQLQLKRRMLVLLAEVPFVGCAGLEIDDEMRVLIAAQAALLLLGRGGGFGGLREVLVYPGHFVAPHSESGAGGVVHESRAVLAGQSWQRGQVILAGDAVLEGAADAHDGANVVIHEFAHQIDQDKGVANGAPFLGRRADGARWARVMQAEFDALRVRLAHGESGLIDGYAAHTPAEFFAVISELFFEKPAALAEQHPALYAELLRCYRVDPRLWAG
jgi:Mlc titration factor MtfA (ptsG expression regulator)